MTKLKWVAAIAAAFFVGLIGVTSISSSSVEAARMDMVDVLNNNGYMSTAEYISMRNEFGVKAVTVMSIKQLKKASHLASLFFRKEMTRCNCLRKTGFGY